MNDIKIYSTKIARRLINSKFMVIDIEENKKPEHRGKTVFTFENSSEIREFLKVIYKINIPENIKVYKLVFATDYDKYTKTVQEIEVDSKEGTKTVYLS